VVKEADLGSERAGKGVGGVCEGREKAVTLASAGDDESPGLVNGPVQQLVVALDGNSHLRRIVLPQPGGTFDVGEQEGYDAGWKGRGGLTRCKPGHLLENRLFN